MPILLLQFRNLLKFIILSEIGGIRHLSMVQMYPLPSILQEGISYLTDNDNSEYCVLHLSAKPCRNKLSTMCVLNN